MKVLHFIWSASAGGIEKVVTDLIHAQQKNSNLQPMLLTGREDKEKRLKSSGIAHDSLQMRNGFEINWTAYRKARKLFDAHDIVHLHAYNPLVAMAAGKSKAALIYTEHGNFGFGRKKNWKDLIVQSLQKRFLNKNVSMMLFNSAFTKRTAEDRFGLFKIEKRIIYNGINTLQVTGVPGDLESVAEGKFVVGCIARIATVKRLDRLINAFTVFAKDKNDCILLIIGDGPVKGELIHLAERNGISGKVIFAGYRIDARQCLNLFDICAFPSANEAFGLVAIEAWSAGKPVIAFSDSGGLAELINGFSKDDLAEDEKEYAALMEDYYADRKVHKESARKEYASRFSIEKMEEEVYSVYRHVRN